MPTHATPHARPRLAAQPRAESQRKSEIRGLRRQGIVPATLFAHGAPQQIQVTAKAIQEHLRHHSQTGMLDLEVDGRPIPALIREMERDPVTGKVIHLGFQRIDLAEQIHAMVPITFMGEDHLTKENLVFERQLSEVDVVCQADHLPESITIDVTHMTAGTIIHASDLELPEGVALSKDGTTIVALVSRPFVPADVQAEMDAQDVERAELAVTNAQAAVDAEAAAAA